MVALTFGISYCLHHLSGIWTSSHDMSHMIYVASLLSSRTPLDPSSRYGFFNGWFSELSKNLFGNVGTFWNYEIPLEISI